VWPGNRNRDDSARIGLVCGLLTTGPHEGRPGPFITSERPGPAPLDRKGRRVAPPVCCYRLHHNSPTTTMAAATKGSRSRLVRVSGSFIVERSGYLTQSNNFPEIGPVPPQRPRRATPLTAWPSAQPRNSRLLPPSRPPHPSPIMAMTASRMSRSARVSGPLIAGPSDQPSLSNNLPQLGPVPSPAVDASRHPVKQSPCNQEPCNDARVSHLRADLASSPGTALVAPVPQDLRLGGLGSCRRLIPLDTW
jgi:hypothetical protein